MSLDEQALIQLTDDLHTWKAKWEPHIARWTAIHRHENESFAQMIEALPPLLQLMVNLLKDPGFNRSADADPIAEAVRYVFDEDDALPESELGVSGLSDDVKRVVMVLAPMLKQYQVNIVNNWPQKTDISDLLERLQAHYTDGERDTL